MRGKCEIYIFFMRKEKKNKRWHYLKEKLTVIEDQREKEKRKIKKRNRETLEIVADEKREWLSN